MAKEEGCISLQFLDHFCCAIGRPYPYEDMDMLRLDRKPENVPSFLLALCFKKLLTAVLEFSYKNRLPSFGTPDEMIDNEMDSVFIPLIFKLSLVCRFHVLIYSKIDKLSIGLWLKPRRNPPIRVG